MVPKRSQNIFSPFSVYSVSGRNCWSPLPCRSRRQFFKHLIYISVHFPRCFFPFCGPSFLYCSYCFCIRLIYHHFERDPSMSYNGLCKYVECSGCCQAQFLTDRVKLIFQVPVHTDTYICLRHEVFSIQINTAFVYKFIYIVNKLYKIYVQSDRFCRKQKTGRKAISYRTRPFNIPAQYVQLEKVKNAVAVRHHGAKKHICGFVVFFCVVSIQYAQRVDELPVILHSFDFRRQICAARSSAESLILFMCAYAYSDGFARDYRMSHFLSF